MNRTWNTWLSCVALVCGGLCLQGVDGIVGYDCGSPKVKLRTISLLDVQDCGNVDGGSTRPPRVERTYIRLLHRSQLESVNVTLCKVYVDRSVYHCGMHAHISAVKYGKAKFVGNVTANACRRMHRDGTLAFSEYETLSGLEVNRTTTRSVSIAGKITPDGYCRGVKSYSDPYGTWCNVVVQGVVTVTLTTYRASVNVETNRVELKSGIVCRYTDAICLDSDGGYAFWQTTLPFPPNYCDWNRYGIVYEGFADKTLNVDYYDQRRPPETVYSFATDNLTLALTKTGEDVSCGFTLVTTRHPNLLVFEGSNELAFLARRKLSTEHLDVTLAYDSKHAYAERRTRTLMNALYRDVERQRCTVEQQLARSALSLAVNSPDEFAYVVKGPGHRAVTRGEVVHVVECVPVDVEVRYDVKECYSELPVKRDNATYFLSPLTHTLKTTGTPMPCNPMTPTMFSLNANWYRVVPSLAHTVPPAPIVVGPMTKLTWRYSDPGSSAANGTYGFPAEEWK